MKNRILKILKLFIDWLSVQYSKHSPKKEINLPYHSLSPTDNAEKVDDYIETIEWALNKRNKIKNIAVSGPYGSGKSSVIKTFQNKHKHNDEYNFLNISLATFKEEKTKEKHTDSDNKEDLLRLIELSILQQLFYHEKDNKIPDSRFKKIKSHKNKYLLITTIGLLLFIISFLHLVFPTFLAKFSLLELSSQYGKIFHSAAVIVVIIGSILLIYKIIGILKRFTIKKFGISNASVEIDNKISKSILNNHIDEILYFFEVTDYNIIILEDLDRFEQTDVFTKLREINLLINNSKKIENDVVFIYAIRDDMFLDKDRTKFFDFMIPIIPVINSSNSNDRLLKIIQTNKYTISEDLTDDISLFIDDMRLLYNIMNEYHLYFKKLNKTLDQNKLLSMIVYKNIYPNDFTKLSQNEGELFSTIINKHKYIEEEISKVDDEIVEIKENIENYENTKLNIEELRIIYLSKIIEKIKQSNPNRPFYNFLLNNEIVSIYQATKSKNFNLIINSNTLQYTYSINHGFRENYNLDFASIENEVNSQQTYNEREDLILNKDKIKKLKDDIETLEVTKNEIKKYKIKDLISDKAIHINTDNQNQKYLIKVLLRNGYIDENYLSYISIFYEGSLSKNDHQFLINIKTQKNNEFDYHLQKKENLLKRINEYEFEKEYILNYDLLDFLINSSKFPVKRKKYLTQLSTESNTAIKFIDGFIDHTANIDRFIRYLCKEWITIWDFVLNKSKYTEEKTKKYFKLIIKYADVSDIRKIFSNSKSSISENQNFLLLIENSDKLKGIIKELDIKFNVLNESSPKELLDYVYDNNCYSLNIHNIRFFLKYKNKLVRNTFETENYSSIKQSKLDKLIDYIDTNINEYITSVYLYIDTNTKETYEYYIQLLNNVNILEENKIRIIAKVKTQVDDINDIDDAALIEPLLQESKISATWNNLIDIYIQNESEITAEMTTFINITKNAEELSKVRIKTDEPEEETVNAFLNSLLLNEEIENKNYSLILSSIPYIYSTLNFENLSFDKVNLLINKNILATNTDNFELLKTNFENLHISLIENNPKLFIKDIDSFEVENEELLALLESTKIPIQLKEDIIESYEKSIFTLDSDLLTQIGELLLHNSNINIDTSIIMSIGTNSNLKILDKIKLFNKWNEIYNNQEISALLISLGKPYSSISKNGKRPLLNDNETNRNLAESLDLKNYISKYKIEKKKGIRISTYRNK